MLKFVKKYFLQLHSIRKGRNLKSLILISSFQPSLKYFRRFYNIGMFSGLIYTITDVENLHIWMVKHISEHPLFEKLNESEMMNDPIVKLLYDSTEEGQKVTRNKGKKWAAVYRKRPDPDWL